MDRGAGADACVTERYIHSVSVIAYGGRV